MSPSKTPEEKVIRELRRRIDGRNRVSKNAVGKRLRFKPSKNGQKTHVKGVDKREKV